jgi:hypothetical protein
VGEWGPAPSAVPVHHPELATPSYAHQWVASLDSIAQGTPPRPITGMPGGAVGSLAHALYTRPSTGGPHQRTWGPRDQHMGGGWAAASSGEHRRPSTGTSWGPTSAPSYQGLGGASDVGAHGLPKLASLGRGPTFGGMSPHGGRRMLPSLGGMSLGESGSPYGLRGTMRYSDGSPNGRDWGQDTARAVFGRAGNLQDPWNPHVQEMGHTHASSPYFRGTDQVRSPTSKSMLARDIVAIIIYALHYTY